MPLGAFAKLQKATVSFIMCVPPSASNNSAAVGRIFMKFNISAFFANLPGKLFHKNVTRIRGTIREDYVQL